MGAPKHKGRRGSLTAVDIGIRSGTTLGNAENSPKEYLILYGLWPIMNNPSSEGHVRDPTLESKLLSTVTGNKVDEEELYRIGRRAYCSPVTSLIKEGTMNYKTLEFESRDHIGWLTLNRPESLNALSSQMVKELREFFLSLEDNLDIRVVIIRGAGRGFCSGLDLKESFGGRTQAGKESTESESPSGYGVGQRAFSELYIRMRQAPQPLIAAVNGIALGGGFSLALACDIRIASESARFNIGFIRVGFSACDMGSSYFLPRLIGLSRAAEYMYTGRFMDSATAERIGLVSRVVPDDELDEAAEELAREMLNASPFGLRMTKEVLNVNVDAPSLMAACWLENRTQMLCGRTEDAQEAVRAIFFEKRPPVYKDR